MDYALVSLFGLLTGWAELLSRYRDSPVNVLRSFPAWIYVAFNIAAAVGALVTLRIFDVEFGIAANTNQLLWTQVVVAGFGAMVLFRSSVFVFRAGDQDVSVGPAAILQILLSVVDREVDRNQAKTRANVVKELMTGISFRKASDPLPTIVIALMQNLANEASDRIITKVTTLSANIQISEETKAFALGLSLLDAVGPDVLKAAVELIREEIAAEEEDPLLNATEETLRKTFLS